MSKRGFFVGNAISRKNPIPEIFGKITEIQISKNPKDFENWDLVIGIPKNSISQPTLVMTFKRVTNLGVKFNRISPII